MKSAKRTFVPLANVYAPKKHRLNTKMVSIKLDGMRALWDGGLTRGLLAKRVPFANIEKDHRLLADPVCTGLWSRYGKVIHAPDSFLDHLPVGQMLDGELYTDRNQLQIVVGTAKAFVPDETKWKNINYHVFDAPTYGQFAREGVIYETHFKKTFDPTIKDWVDQRVSFLNLQGFIQGGMPFEDVYKVLRSKQDSWSDRIRLVGHFDAIGSNGEPFWEEFYEREIELGGEGVMFRDKYVGWVANRHDGLLKHKPDFDSEAVVLGWKSGRKTDLDSRWLGKMGAILVRWPDGPQGSRDFWISGFNEGERTLRDPEVVQWALENPDTTHPIGDGMLFFEPGDMVQFKYGELTSDGVPRRAVFKRKRAAGQD